VWRVPGGPWDGLLSVDERSYYFGHSIIVTVADRGLFTHALDLSYGAFSLLGRPSEGVIAIVVQPLDGTPARWQLPQ
jgi:rare lipoprotein A (peptidoglycan hydrolase)